MDSFKKNPPTISLDGEGGREFVRGAGEEIRRVILQEISSYTTPLKIQSRNLQRDIDELQIAVDQLYKRLLPDVVGYEGEDSSDSDNQSAEAIAERQEKVARINRNVLQASEIAAKLLKDSLKEMGTAVSPAKVNQCAANAMLCVKVLEFIADHSEE